MLDTAAELVMSAYYLSNVKDPGEPIEGYEATIGLELLNSIIDQWSGLSIYIPTYSEYVFDTVANGSYQYDHTPPITQLLESNLIDSNNVQTQLWQVDLKGQNELNYALAATSPGRPDRIFIRNDADDEIAGKSTIFLFPPPSQVYRVTLYLKQFLTPKTYSEQILDIPARNKKALRFQLASDLSIEFASILPPKFEKEYDRIMKELRAANKRDVRVRTQNIFADRYRRFRPYGGWYG